MSITRTFTQKELFDWEMPDYAPDGGKIVLDEIIDHTRWSVIHRIVFQMPEDGPLVAWEGSYSVGATESQDECPWEYEDEVVFTRVALVEKTIQVWEPVKDE